MTQVVYDNYTSNKFKELSEFLGDFMFFENCNEQKFVLIMFLL